MKTLFSKALYRDERYYSSFPSAVTLGDGRILVLFRRARDHRWLMSGERTNDEAELDDVDHVDSRSHIAAITVDTRDWSVSAPWTLPIDPQAGDQDPSLLRLRDGRVMQAGFGWYPVSAERIEALRSHGVWAIDGEGRKGGPYLFWGGHTRFSSDGGRTWTDHAPLPPLPDCPEIVPGRRPWHGGAVRGRPVELPDGTLLIAAYGPLQGLTGSATYLHASTDGGRSWEVRARIAESSDGNTRFEEPALLRLTDGRLIALHRTAGLEDRLVLSQSRDDGRTWGQWTVHDIIGHPHDAEILPDGRVFLVYGYRHQPFGVRARVWDPEHEAPEAASEGVIRDDAPSPDTGYPWACALPDGRVFVVYYIADEMGVRHIAGSLVDPG
jgi:hypothetical protein